MGGLDYEEKARSDEKKVFEDPQISETNKGYLRSFLLTYHVSPARRSIFFRMVRHIMRATPDLKRDLDERDLFNKLFAELYRQYRPATYNTIVNVSRRMARWLNDDVLPNGFRDIRTLPKKQIKRDLDPADMITWQDGLAMAASTTDIQLKAILLTQLDGGFRPSEIVYLRYGDINLRGPLVMAYIRKGKTGTRLTVLHRCADALRTWLEHHPTKKDDDPLWVSMSKLQSRHWGPDLECPTFSYEAIRKHIRKMAMRAGVTKPTDFYSLRHASCVLDKKSNLPVDLAAERHGHSVKFYTEVYGRLSHEDIANRFLKHYGLDAVPARDSPSSPALPDKTVQEIEATALQCANSPTD